MNRSPWDRRWLLAVCLLVVASCSSEQAPTTAQYLPPAEAQSRFGDVIIRYNALPTLSLPQATAKEYGLPRDADTAMLIVAARKQIGGEETPLTTTVTGTATDLSGKRQELRFHQVVVGDYLDQMGKVATSPNDRLRFDLQVSVGGKTHRLQFERGF